MPVIIKELLIKASVEDPGQGVKPAVRGTTDDQPVDRRALIEACVEEVLKILARKEER
jgi:hypothetical protein